MAMGTHSPSPAAARGLAALLLLLAVVAAPPAAATAQPTFQPKLPQRASSDRIIVKLKPAAGKAGAEGVTRPQVHLLTGGETVDAALKRLNARPDVAYAVPDQYLQLADTTPNDPDFDQQWGLQRIGAPAAWDVSTGSAAAGRQPSGVTVCVVDSGVDTSHPDLQGNLHPAVGLNAVDPTSPMTDSVGHGTHVSGIIAAVGNNALGVSGVNWGGAVKVLACRFIGSDGYGMTSTAITCIQYCTSMGAQIISASWTGGTATNPPLQDAITAATAAGALFVTAAGNSGYNMDAQPEYPAAYSSTMGGVISVGASDSQDAVPSFSNYGATTVQLFAPGVAILSTVPGASYQSWSGTSMATPFVSGAAALLLAATGGSLTAAQLRQALVGSAEAVSAFAGLCSSGGELRVDSALSAALAMQQPAPVQQPSPSPVQQPAPVQRPSPSPAYRTVTTKHWVACRRGTKGCRARCVVKKVTVNSKVYTTRKCVTQKPLMPFVRAVVTTKRVRVADTAPAAGTAKGQSVGRRLLRDLS